MACERDPSARMRNPGASGPRTEREEVPMAIVGGLDIHRRQITYDWIDTDSGETCRGQLGPATRLELRAWLARFTGQQADFALEATTGWRFVAEELTRAARTWPSRPTPGRCAVPSGAPRPTGSTPATCASCCAAAPCPSRGCHRR